MTSNPKEVKIAIAGLGNELLGDDGVGIHAVRKLAKSGFTGAIVCEVGTAALHWQGVIEESDVVIAIDAVHADGPPGSIYRFDADDVEKDQGFSLHELGIMGVLRLIPADRRPRVIILGVEPGVIDYTMDLSPAVEKALLGIVKAVRTIVDEITRPEMHDSKDQPCAGETLEVTRTIS